MKNAELLNEFLYFVDTYYDNNEETNRKEFSLSKKETDKRKTYEFTDKRNLDKEGYDNHYMITNNIVTINLKNTKRFDSPEEMNLYLEDITDVLNNSIEEEKTMK